MEDTGPLTAIIWACHWLRWVFMDHTTYSPDITPSKFDSFRCLKKYLAGKRLAKNADVKQAVTSWPDSWPPFFLRWHASYNEIVEEMLIYIYLSILTMWRSECTVCYWSAMCTPKWGKSSWNYSDWYLIFFYSFVLVLACIFFVRRPIDNKVTVSCKIYFVVYGDSELLFKISKIPLHVKYFLTLM